MTDPTVIVTTEGVSGRLLLNRPKALNSLDTEMVDLIAEALERWRDDDAVRQVIITSGHPTAFCAGGDVRTVREQILEGDHASGDEFFRREYDMNHAMAEYPKPYVAVIDGIAMGGGLGASMHGSHRIVTERASAAMPEMAIGFVPDVGITWFSQHVEGHGGRPDPGLARFIGLTGYRLTAADMLWAGWATHFVPSDDVPALLEAADVEGIDAALERFAADPADAGEPGLAAIAERASAVFGADSWMDIAAGLDEGEFADLLAPASPTSLVAAAELYTANVGVDLRAALDNEAAVGALMRRRRDFDEGVRAVLKDKTRDAAWEIPDAADVDPEPFREALRG